MILRHPHVNRQLPAIILPAVPPSITPILMVLYGGSILSSRVPSIVKAFALEFKNTIHSAATDIAFTPACVCEACPGYPVTSVSKSEPPLCAFTSFIPVGSPIIAPIGMGRSFIRRAISPGAPKQPISSS